MAKFPSWRPLVVLLLGLAAGPLVLLAQEGAVVRSLSFEGNNTLDDAILRPVMMTYPTSWLEEKIFGTDPYYFGNVAFQEDLQNIVTEYQREGFLGARIDTAIVTTDEEGLVASIEIHIREGEYCVIDTVTAEAVGDSAALAVFHERWPPLMEDFALRAGERFRDANLLSDRQVISEAFSSRGYAYAQARANLTVDSVRHRVAVHWTVDPGPLCRFGQITVVGNDRVPGSLIEGKIPFREGDTYNGVELGIVQQDIYALGQFQTVILRPRLNEARDPTIPVSVTIQEARSLKAKFGAGYGSEEHIRAFLELKRLGFLGGARTLTLDAKYSSLTPLNAGITLSQPDFLFPKVNLYLRPYVLYQKEVGYSVNRYGGDITIEHRFFRALLTTLSYTLEQVHTPEDQVQNTTGPTVYNKSAVGLSLTLNSSSPLFDPTSGWLNALRLFYSGLPPTPEINFFRALYDLRKYTEVTDDIVLAARVKIGNIWPLAESGFVPPEERFYAGGSYSVRGYSRNRLGPTDETGTPIGGLSLLEGSVEVRLPIRSALGAVVFLDAGNVWESELTYTLKDIAYAAGVGLRYDTPVGPVRLDAAHSLTDLGAAWQFHFSIGQAF